MRRTKINGKGPLKVGRFHSVENNPRKKAEKARRDLEGILASGPLLYSEAQRRYIGRKEAEQLKRAPQRFRQLRLVVYGPGKRTAFETPEEYEAHRAGAK